MPAAIAPVNIARHLALMAEAQPCAPALKIPRGRTRIGEIDYLALSFAELAAEARAWAARLDARGVRRGDRTLVMVRPGLPLIAVTFALFQRGAIPVIIDPGMGLGSFLSCVARSQPRALVGIPLAQWISRVFRRPFRTVSCRVAVSRSLTARLTTKSADGSSSAIEAAPTAANDLAAVLFTSGSTGAPKGVCYEHGMFESQVRTIRETYAIEAGEVDLPMLPIFALFNPALGMTTIVPEIDPRRPAAVDPAKIVQAIRQESVTNSFGSPTLWNKIADHCLAHNVTLPTLRRVLCAGAPVPTALWEKSRHLLPQGKLHSPYGATEALPVSSISSDDARATPGRGTCVGRPVGDARIRIIALTDEPLVSLDAAGELPRGQVGEIVVSGPMVTREYDALPDATRLAKIVEASTGLVWHRMGDCGYVDDQGWLWFCGRKAERVVTANGPLFTEPCEQVFREHPMVERCALIGLGRRGEQRPALVVQQRKVRSTPSVPPLELARELRARGRAHASTAEIARFFFHPDFPVDVRHNAKIHRLTLAKWAATRRPIEVP